MDRKNYRWCAVPTCKNTSITTPNKIFIDVPRKENIRKKWLDIAGRNFDGMSSTSAIFFCEDHFDLPNDMENYMRYHIMGYVDRVMMKPGCLPSKFDWQTDRKSSSSSPCPAAAKRQRLATLQEAFKESKQAGKNGNTSNCKRKKTGTMVELSIPELNETKSVTSHHCPSPTHSDVPEAEPEVLIPESWLKYEPVSVENDTLTGDVLSAEDITVKVEIQESDEFPTGDAAEDQYVPEKHEGFSCDCCMGDIIGYTCVQCEKYDLCSVCEGRLVHPRHYMLRVAVPKTFTEVKNVIAEIRAKIEMLEDALKQNNATIYDCMEIKKEVDPLPFEDVDMQFKDTEEISFEENTLATNDTTEKDSMDEAIEDVAEVENWWHKEQSNERKNEDIKKNNFISKKTSKRKKVDDVRVYCY